MLIIDFFWNFLVDFWLKFSIDHSTVSIAVTPPECLSMFVSTLPFSLLHTHYMFVLVLYNIPVFSNIMIFSKWWYWYRHDIGILIYRELLCFARKVMEKSIFIPYIFPSDSCNNKDILCSMLLCLHAFIMAPVCQSVQYILTHKVTKYNCHMLWARDSRYQDSL